MFEQDRINKERWANMEPWERDNALLTLVGKLADVCEILGDRIADLETLNTHDHWPL